MAFCYNKLWKLLIDKGINKTELRVLAKLSSSTVARLGKNLPVSMQVLEKICTALECDIPDIVDFPSDRN